MIRIPLHTLRSFEKEDLPRINQFILNVVGSLSDKGYGEMYNDNNDTIINLAVSDTDYPITGFTAGTLEGFTFSSNTLICNNPGTYWVAGRVSMHGAANLDVEISLHVDDVRQPNITAHIAMAGANNNQSVIANGILVLARDDIIKLKVRSHVGTGNVTITHSSVNLHKLDD